jgi:FMN reductase
MTRVLAVVGNPRPGSRTHLLARTLAQETARATGGSVEPEVDLAAFGARVLDYADAEVGAAVERVLDADVLVVASPTYKATYSGLAKAFLDRLGTGSLQGRRAVPLLLGGATDHKLAVDVHFTPLLLELGASTPARGLFVLESEVDTFPTLASMWADEHRAVLANPAPVR